MDTDHSFAVNCMNKRSLLLLRYRRGSDFNHIHYLPFRGSCVCKVSCVSKSWWWY